MIPQTTVLLRSLLFFAFVFSFLQHDAQNLHISITSQDVSCSGINDGRATVHITGAQLSTTTIQWSNGSISKINDNLSAGIYFVTVTDFSTNETATDFTRIKGGGPELSTYGGGTLPCDPDSIEVGATSTTGGVTFEWSYYATVLSNQASIFAHNIGTYNVVATDSLGCINSAEVEIHPAPRTTTSSVSIHTTLSCISPIIQVDTLIYSSPVEFWINPQGDTLVPPAILTEVGYYKLWSTADTFNCRWSLGYTIDYDSFPILTGAHSSNPIAPGTLNCEPILGTPPYTFEWFLNGQLVSTLQNPSSMPAGNYSLLVTDANGCQGWNEHSVVIEVAVKNCTPDGYTQFRIFPNITSSIFTIENRGNGRLVELEAQIFGIFGKAILAQKITEKITQIDISTLLSGMYWLRILEIQTGRVRYVGHFQKVK